MYYYEYIIVNNGYLLSDKIPHTRQILCISIYIFIFILLYLLFIY